MTLPVYLTSDDVRDILHLLDSLPFAELHLRTESFHLSLRRAADGEWTQTTQVRRTPRIITGPGTAPAAVTSPGSAPAPGSATAPRDGLIEVRAPLPGTFYRAPRPGSPPFVEAGSAVGPDTVVGIIETMKLMNSVHAGREGTVAEICVADAGFAGEGTVLMRIDPEPGRA